MPNADHGVSRLALARADLLRIGQADEESVRAPVYPLDIPAATAQQAIRHGRASRGLVCLRAMRLKDEQEVPAWAGSVGRTTPHDLAATRTRRGR